MKVCLACGSPRCDGRWVCADCGHEPAVVDSFTVFAPTLASANSGFREEFFGELAQLEAASFWFRARSELILWAMKRYLPGSQRFLEIGCGTGFVLSGICAAFPSAELSGSEISTAGLGYAAKRVPTARFYQLDARNLPFRDEFDIIGAFDVLEHIDDDEAVIAQVAKALRPSGVFLATVPQHPALWSPQDDHALHVRRYTGSEVRRKVEAAGFEVLRMTSFVSMLLPAMVASRRLMRDDTAASEFDAIDAIRLPRPVNVALEAVMSIERACIRLGLSFPAGGSLLLVARRRNGAGSRS